MKKNQLCYLGKDGRILCHLTLRKGMKGKSGCHGYLTEGGRKARPRTKGLRKRLREEKGGMGIQSENCRTETYSVTWGFQGGNGAKIHNQDSQKGKGRVTLTAGTMSIQGGTSQKL